MGEACNQNENLVFTICNREIEKLNLGTCGGWWVRLESLQLLIQSKICFPTTSWDHTYQIKSPWCFLKKLMQQKLILIRISLKTQNLKFWFTLVVKSFRLFYKYKYRTPMRQKIKSVLPFSRLHYYDDTSAHQILKF